MAVVHYVYGWTWESEQGHTEIFSPRLFSTRDAAFAYLAELAERNDVELLDGEASFTSEWEEYWYGSRIVSES